MLTYPRKHFMIPEIIYDPSLLLSPHVFLLAILIRHRAFKAQALNDAPEKLCELRVHPTSNELPLTLRPELNDTHIFRRAERTVTGFKTSEKKPIGYSMMSKWVKRIGLLLGFEHNTICYNLRYMAGNKLDQSGASHLTRALPNLYSL